MQVDLDAVVDGAVPVGTGVVVTTAVGPVEGPSSTTSASRRRPGGSCEHIGYRPGRRRRGHRHRRALGVGVRRDPRRRHPLRRRPLALGRLLVAVLVLGAALLVRGEGLPPRAAWPGIACSGLFWFGAYMVCLNAGEQLVDAGTAALVVNIGPVLIALLSGWLLKEGFLPRLMVGLVIAFVGACVIGLASSRGGHALLLGVLLCLVAAVGYAIGVVAQKPALRTASALQATTFGCLIGAVACLPFAGQLVDELAVAPVGAVVQVVYLGVFPTAVAFSTWAFGAVVHQRRQARRYHVRGAGRGAGRVMAAAGRAAERTGRSRRVLCLLGWPSPAAVRRRALVGAGGRP